MRDDRSPPEVVVTGYAGIDHIARTREAVPPGYTGIIEDLPVRPAYGGCAPNVAVGMARLGVHAAVAMIVGDDAEGRDYLAYLAGQRVDTRQVVTVTGGRTPRTYLFVPPEGPTSLFFDRGAAADWDGPFEITLDGARLAVLTVGPRTFNRKFVETAAAGDVPLAWQLKGDIQAYPADHLPGLVARTRYLFMNEQEGEYLRSSLGAPSMADLGGFGPEGIFITRGASGSLLVLASAASSSVPSVPASIVDTTGAGDAFTAGTLAGVLRGWPLLEAAHLGAVVASFALEAVGAQAGLPDRQAALARYTLHFGPPPGKV